MAKAAVYSLISENDDLRGIGFSADSFFGSAAADSPEVRPFMIIRWGAETPVFGRVSSDTVTVWVYDEPGDYGRINKALKILEGIFSEAIHVAGADGYTLTQADWNGNSEDLYDDIYKCIVRNGVYTVVGRPS